MGNIIPTVALAMCGLTMAYIIYYNLWHRPKH